jgi:hypothetical protein
MRLIMLLFLAGCAASPAPEFIGTDRVEVEREGSRYAVWQREERFEVVRLGYARNGQHRAIRATMLALVPEVTGCKVVESSVLGDSGEMRGRLTCPSAAR